MKSLILAILLMLVAAPIARADEASELSKKEKKELEKLEKAQREAIEQRNDSLRFSVLRSAIEGMRFVIVADRLRDRYGKTTYVNENTNFILVHDDEATVQIALERGMTGFNGIGGFTCEGRVTHVENKLDKKGNLVFRMTVNGSNIKADVYFTLPKNGNRCSATVKSNLSSMNITLEGTVSPYQYKTFAK
ncbi:MAG: DUF4251 domain-containing protein [Candidatus Limisoma sp.]